MPYTQRLETHFPVQVLVCEHQGMERMNADLHALIAEMRKLHSGMRPSSGSCDVRQTRVARS